MSDYIVLENIPNTPEGRLFLKQLRKYLRPQYKMRSRGRHSDRKGLAKELAAKGVYGDNVAKVHHTLRTGMSCKYAERITTTIEANNDREIQWRTGQKKGFFYRTWAAKGYEWHGPFKTMDAARAAHTVAVGTKSK